jgi:WD40 repeat protein
LTTVAGNQSVRVWDLATGEAVQSLSHEQTTLMRVFLSANGRRLGFVSNRGDLQVWDVARLARLPE